MLQAERIPSSILALVATHTLTGCPHKKAEPPRSCRTARSCRSAHQYSCASTGCSDRDRCRGRAKGPANRVRFVEQLWRWLCLTTLLVSFPSVLLLGDPTQGLLPGVRNGNSPAVAIARESTHHRDADCGPRTGERRPASVPSDGAHAHAHIQCDETATPRADLYYGWLSAAALRALRKRRRRTAQKNRSGRVESLEHRAAPGGLLPFSIPSMLATLDGQTDPQLLGELMPSSPLSSPRSARQVRPASPSAIPNSASNPADPFHLVPVRIAPQHLPDSGSRPHRLEPPLMPATGPRAKDLGAGPSSETDRAFPTTTADSNRFHRSAFPLDTLSPREAPDADMATKISNRSARSIQPAQPTLPAGPPAGFPAEPPSGNPPSRTRGSLLTGMAEAPPVAVTPHTLDLAEGEATSTAASGTDLTSSRTADSALNSLTVSSPDTTSASTTLANSTNTSLDGANSLTPLQPLTSQAFETDTNGSRMQRRTTTELPAFSPFCSTQGQPQGWTISQFGGSGLDAGNGQITEHQLVLSEGNSFLVLAEQMIRVPDEPHRLVMELSVDFEVGPQEWINDAFEIALLDAQQQSVVRTFRPEADAFYNLTEPDPDHTPTAPIRETVDLDLSDLPAGESYRLVLRLINNDHDQGSTVTLFCPVPPVAQDDSYITDEDTSLIVDAATGVLSNDRGSQPTDLSTRLLAPPRDGELEWFDDGGFRYLPRPDFFGTDQFTYELLGTTQVSQATVTLTVAARNDVPRAQDDLATTWRREPVRIDLLVNDSDIDGDPLVVTNVDKPMRGTVTLQSDGSVLYTPRPDFYGVDAFNYTISDPAGALASARVQVEVIDDGSGTPSQQSVWVIDDGDNGFTLQPVTAVPNIGPDHWASHAGYGWNQDYLIHRPGTGLYASSWKFEGLSPGRYQVAVSYPDPSINPNPWSLASNAPFTLFDGAFPVATVAVDQRLPANDFSDRQQNWESLGIFEIRHDTLTIQLSDRADGYVKADAVRLEAISAGPEVTLLVDGHQRVNWAEPLSLTTSINKPLIRSLQIRNDGNAGLRVETIELINNPTGNWSLPTPQPLPLVIAPREVFTLPVTFHAHGLAGQGDFPADIRLRTNDPDEPGIVVPLRGVVTNQAILDDGEPGFVARGGWTYTIDPNSNTMGVDRDSWSLPGDRRGATARWTFSPLPVGSYRVSTSYIAPLSGGNPSVPFTVRDGSQIIATWNLDQSRSTRDFSTEGAWWKDLGGPYWVNNGELSVEVSDLTNGVGQVIADAVRIERLWEPATDVTVLVDQQEVVDDTGRIDFGTTVPGRSIRKEFWIRAQSRSAVGITPPTTLPPGFELVDFTIFPTADAANHVARFTLEMTAQSPGSFLGEVVLGTADPDEPHYNFLVSGTVDASRIIDDRDTAAFTHTGFQPFPNQGWGSAIRYTQGDSSGDRATWTFRNLNPGSSYLVSATWSPAPTRTRRAPYTITGVVGGPLRVELDQTRTPSDRATQGSVFQDLGVFTVTGNELTVTVSDQTTGEIIADAVRIQPVMDGQIEFWENGTRLPATTRPITFGSTGLSNQPLIKQLEIRNRGPLPADIKNLQLPVGFELLTPAPTQVAAGATTVLQIGLNRNQPGAFRGSLQLQLDNQPTTLIELTGHVLGTAQIVDNRDPAPTYTQNGFLSFSGGYGGTFHATISDRAQAEFRFASLSPGLYRVSTTWTAHLNRSMTARYSVLESGQATRNLAEVTLNQQRPAADFQAVNTNWADLGFVRVTEPTLIVRVHGATNGYVEADAVRVERLTNQPELDLLVESGQTWANIVQEVTFGDLTLGQTLTRNLLVRNLGELPLHVSSVRASQPFELLTPEAFTIPAGGTEIVSIRFAPNTAGQYTGELWLVNNDSDENSWRVRMTGNGSPWGTRLDDGDPGYFDTGFTLVKGNGFHRDVRTSVGGSGKSAFWNFSGLQEEVTYRLLTTWTAATNRATNVPYLVHGLAGGNVIYQVDQRLNPADLNAEGVAWKELGLVRLHPGQSTLGVELRDATATRALVVADAVRLEAISTMSPQLHLTWQAPLANTPRYVIQDDLLDLGTTFQGTATRHRFAVTNMGGSPLVLDAHSLLASVERITGVRLVESLGKTNLSPGESTTFTLEFTAQFRGQFAGTLNLNSNAASQGQALRFSIRGAVLPDTRIIDNDNSGYTSSGAWQHYGFGHAGDLRFAPAVATGYAANYTFSGLAPGATYLVAATWQAWYTRATQAPYRIAGLAAPTVVSLNQRLSPGQYADSFSDKGSQWKPLGAFQADLQGNLTVTLSSVAQGDVVADAIRIERDFGAPGATTNGEGEGEGNSINTRSIAPAPLILEPHHGRITVISQFAGQPEEPGEGEGDTTDPRSPGQATSPAVASSTRVILNPLPDEVQTEAKLLISGTIEQPQPGQTIRINERVASVLDAAGNFFDLHDIRPGENRFTLDTDAPAAVMPTTRIQLAGVAEEETQIDFSTLEPAVSRGFLARYGMTSFRERDQRLLVDISFDNAGAFSVKGPLLVAITDLTHPLVRPVDTDGVSPTGLAFLNLDFEATQHALPPGASTADRLLQFVNPQRAPFSYELEMFGVLNRAPRFTSLPVVNVLAGTDYDYPVTAYDPDRQPLQFSLVTGPQGMEFDPRSQTISWQPDASRIGNHNVQIRVRDVEGREDVQTFVVTVSKTMPNRPPIWTSTPITEVFVNQRYAYPSSATDADGDQIIYRLESAPAGVAISETNGLLVWNQPSADQLGTHAITLLAIDPAGASSRQTFEVRVLPEPGNHPPLIVTEPLTYFESSGVTVGEPQGDVNPQSIRLSLSADQTHTQTVSLRLAPQELKSDVFLLLDDTESFEPYIPTLQSGFPQVVLALQQEFPGIDFAFGVGRFEDYADFALESASGRPFILNQPIIETDTPNFSRALVSALGREALGNGGDGPESLIEALYQVATGVGFDGNRDGDTSDSGPAGAWLTQMQPGSSGDVPSFASFEADPNRWILPPSGTLGGAGFRFGALPIILAATDAGIAYEPDFVDPLIGIEGNSVPLNRLQGFNYPVGRSYRPSTPEGQGAGLQETVDALKQLGALVVGVGAGIDGEAIRREFAMRADHDPRKALEALAELTGAVNRSPDTLAGSIGPYLDPTTGQPAPADPIEPGDPLYFVLELPQVEPTPQNSTRIVQTGLLNGSHPLDLYVLDGLQGTSGTLRITAVTTPGAGQVTISPDGDYVTYAPNGSFVSDRFEVEVLLDQQTGFRNWYPVTIERSSLPPMGLPDPRPPLALPDSWSLRDIQPGHPLRLLVLNNDREDNGDRVRITHVSQATHGTVSIAPSGDYVIYTPQGPTLQPDTFSYTLADQDGSSTAMVNLHLDPPTSTPLMGFAKNVVDVIATSLRATRLELDLVADHPLTTNLTGKVPNIGLGDTATFDVAFRGDGSAHQFDLRIVRAGTGLVLGSIPVTIAAGYQYQVNAIDPDHDPITYKLIEAPDGATWDSNAKRINWVPDSPGSYHFALEAEDGRGGIDVQRFTVDVGPRTDNQPPELAATAAPAVAEVNRPYRFSLEATDPDGDTLNYWLLDAPAGMEIDRDSGLITWNPGRSDLQPNLAPRDHLFRVRVSDPAGGSDERQFLVTVQPIAPNAPPEIVSHPLKAADQGERYRYDASAQDLNADALTWDLVVYPIGMTVVPSTGTVVWQPTSRDIGRHDVLLRVQDGQGGVDLQSWQINVVEENLPPVIVSSFAPGPVVAGRRFQQHVHAVDPNQDELFYEVDQHARELGVTIDASTGRLTWLPGEEHRGQSHRFSIQVSDGRLHANQMLNLVVASQWTNDEPKLTSQPRTRIRADQTWIYPVEATDPNGDPLQYSILGDVPVGMVWKEHVLSWTPGSADLGTRALTLQIEDGAGGRVEQSFTLEVVGQHTNSAPQLSFQSIHGATVGQPYTLTLQAFDPDHDPLEYRLLNGPSGMILDPQRGTLHWKPTLEQLGSESIEIAVSDPFGSEDQQAFIVTTRAVNLPPQITSVPKTLVGVETLYAYDLRAIDDEGAELTWSLQVSDANGRIVSEPTIDSRGSIRWVPRLDQVGNYQVTAQVRDPLMASASQTWTLVVTRAGNQVDLPPVITSSPPLLAAVGEQLQYSVQAFDPDGSAITFSLVESPEFLQFPEESPMRIEPMTGQLSWAPPAARIGQTIPVAIRASSGTLWAEQRFSLLVQPANREPVILSKAPQAVLAGKRYAYDLTVEDADRDAIQYRLQNAPQGMTIDALGRLRWLTTPADVGQYTFQIEASDGRGSSDPVQTVTFEVLPDIEGPRGSIQVAPAPARVGQTVELFVGAVDNVGVTGRQLTIEGQVIPLDDRGWGRVVRQNPGVFSLQARLEDASGNVGVVDASLIVASDDPSAPRVALREAAEGNLLLHEPTPIYGSIIDLGGDLAWYQLELLTLDGEPLRVLERAEGAPLANRIDVPIGTLDPTLLPNGSYRLRLSADDLDAQNGGPVATEIVFTVHGKLKLGNFAVTFQDLTVPVAGIPITVSRTYDSLYAHQSGDFGYGWRMEIEDTDLQVDFPPGPLSNFGGFPTFRDGTRVTVTRPDGKTDGFTFRPRKEVRSLGLVTIWHPRFVPDPGVESMLRVSDVSLTQVYGDEYISWGAGGIGYNPANPVFGGTYEYFTLDGFKRVLDASTGDVRTIEDRRGNQLTFGRDQISSNRGRAIELERDTRGRIRAIRDPRGNQVTYQYDAQGNLAAVTDRVGNASANPAEHTIRFRYDENRPHFLTSIVDPNGNAAASVQYDEQGRLAGLVDGAGNRRSFQFQSVLREQTTIDPLGFATTVTHDAVGNPIRELSPAGQLTVREYDQHDRLIRETLPDGLLRSFEYDEAGNLRLERDGTGQEMRYTYNAAGQPLTVTDAHGNTTRHFYDGAAQSGADWLAGGLLRLTVDPNQQAVLFGYDARGMVTNVTQNLPFSTSLYYDAMWESGWEPSSDDGASPNPGSTPIRGRKIELKYNTTGDLVTMIDADGNVHSATFDENGNRIDSTQNWINPTQPDRAPQANSITFTFDANDQTLTTQQEAGSSQRRYDGRKLLVEDVDAFGRQTKRTYDSRGLQLESRTRVDNTQPNQTQSSDWVLIRNIYDASGQLKYVTDAYPETTPIAQVTGTHYLYDANGRVVETQRLRGVDIHLVSQSGGMKTLLNGEPTILSTEKVTFDASGRVILHIDQQGRQTANRYNSAGQIIETRTQGRDQNGRDTWLVTRTVYDDSQRVILYTDAYEDAGMAEGSATPRSRPVAAMRPIHDSQGRVVRLQRLEGVVITLAESTMQPAKTVVNDWGMPKWVRETQYAANGQVARTVGEDGQITDYEYDAAGRRIATLGHAVRPVDVGLHPPHATATWVRLRSEVEYDRHGLVMAERTNILRWLSEKGEVVPVAIPGSNQTSQDDRSQQRVVQHDYDQNGNPVRTSYADGSYQQYRYDVRGRLVAEMQPVGQRVSTVWSESLRSFVEVDAAGREGHLVPTTLFAYNPGGLLTSVELPPVPSDIDSNVLIRPRYEYGYDALGNRTLMRDPFGRETRWEYDLAGRQLSRTLPLGFGPDGKAGTADDASRANPFTEFFHYDDHGRLSRHVSFEGTVTVSQYDQSSDGRFGTNDLIAQKYYPSVTSYANGTGTPQEVWSFGYDAFGRQVWMEQQTAEQTQEVKRRHDHDGRLAEVTSHEGTLAYDYDEWGRRSAVRLYASDQADAGYEPTRQIVYSYDALGRLSQVIEQATSQSATDSSSMTQYRYDLAGNIRQLVSSSGALSEHTYDSANRLVATTHYAAPAPSNASSSRQPLAQFEYQLRPDGKRTATRETFWFDTDQDPQTPLEPQVNEWSWEFDAAGRLTDEMVNHFDDRLDRSDHYDFDLVGNRGQKTTDWWSPDSVDEIFQYAYDANDRLLEESWTPQANDAQPNFISVPTTTGYAYHVTQLTGKQVRASGTTAPHSQMEYEYDLQGRLASVINQQFDSNGETQRTRYRYDYDGTGNRVATFEDIATDSTGNAAGWREMSRTGYLVDHQSLTGFPEVLRETTISPQGQIVKTQDYTYGWDELSQTTVEYHPESNLPGAALTSWFAHDAKGNVRLLLDRATSIEQVYTYDAYGALAAIHDAQGAGLNVAKTSLLYSGERMDAGTGLQYLRARYYDPTTGRFTRLDPYAGNPTQPLSWHKYLYTHADPINGLDPSGRSLLGTAFAAFASAQFRALEVGLKVVPVMRTVSIVAGAAAMSGLVGIVLEETGVVPDTSIPEIAFLGGMLIYTFGVSYTSFFDQFRGVMMPVTGPGRVRDSRVINQQLQQQLQYREQPFLRGSMAVQAKPRVDLKLVRFHTNNLPDSNGRRAAESGAWVVPRNEVTGLTPKQIQDKLALPYLPTHVSEVDPQQTEVISGIAAPNFGMQGGGVQLFLTNRGATFSNSQLLQGTFQ